MAAKKKAQEPRESDLVEIELEADVTDRVLEATPARVVKYILGARRYPEIYAKLRARGYSNEVARVAWACLDALGGFDSKDPDSAKPAISEDEKLVTKAMASIDGWDEPNFRLMNSALRKAFPAQHTFVFAGGIQAAKGPMSVYGVRTVIGRLNELESSPARKDTRVQDHAALARLAERGIDKEERKKVEGWLGIVGKHDDTLVAEEGNPMSETQRKNTLIKLRDWFEEWAEVARVAVKQKRELMFLGLAQQRKAATDSDEDVGEDEAVAPVEA